MPSAQRTWPDDLVSVVVPAYNAAGTLVRCVASVTAQTHSNIEIIIVNDGSTDDTESIANDLAEQDPRVRVLTQQNGGLSAARNAGIRAARGVWLQFLDADDWIEPDSLACCLSHAHALALDQVVFGYWVEEEEGGGRVEMIPPFTGVVSAAIAEPLQPSLAGLMGYAWNKLYRRTSLNDQTFVEGLPLIEDMEFNARVLIEPTRVGLLAKPLVHYMQSPHSLGRALHPDHLKLRLAWVEAADRLFARWGFTPEARDTALTQIGVEAIYEIQRRMIHRTPRLSGWSQAFAVFADADAEPVLQRAARTRALSPKHRVYAVGGLVIARLNRIRTLGRKGIQ